MLLYHPLKPCLRMKETSMLQDSVISRGKQWPSEPHQMKSVAVSMLVHMFIVE